MMLRKIYKKFKPKASKPPKMSQVKMEACGGISHQSQVEEPTPPHNNSDRCDQHVQRWFKPKKVGKADTFGYRAIHLILDYLYWYEWVPLRRVSQTFKHAIEQKLLRLIRAQLLQHHTLGNDLNAPFQFLQEYSPNLRSLEASSFPNDSCILPWLRELTIIVDIYRLALLDGEELEALRTRVQSLEAFRFISDTSTWFSWDTLHAYCEDCSDHNHLDVENTKADKSYARSITLQPNFLKTIVAHDLTIIDLENAFIKECSPKILPDHPKKSLPKLKILKFPKQIYKGIPDDFNSFEYHESIEEYEKLVSCGFEPHLEYEIKDWICLPTEASRKLLFIDPSLMPIATLKKLSIGKWLPFLKITWAIFYRRSIRLESLVLKRYATKPQIINLHYARALRHLSISVTDSKEADIYFGELAQLNLESLILECQADLVESFTSRLCPILPQLKSLSLKIICTEPQNTQLANTSNVYVRDYIDEKKTIKIDLNRHLEALDVYCNVQDTKLVIKSGKLLQCSLLHLLIDRVTQKKEEREGEGEEESKLDEFLEFSDESLKNFHRLRSLKISPLKPDEAKEVWSEIGKLLEVKSVSMI